jgi:hypothetical protein
MKRKVFKMQKRILDSMMGMPMNERMTKVRFNDTPTKDDMEEARKDGAIIVVRVKAPSYISKMKMDGAHREAIRLSDKKLDALKIPNGHPRVLVLMDSFAQEAVFQEHVFQMFDKKG